MSAQGTVKSYNATRRFGFITSNGIDYFFHGNDVVERPAKEGDVVTFEIAPNQKDPSKSEAKQVTGFINLLFIYLYLCILYIYPF